MNIIGRVLPPSRNSLFSTVSNKTWYISFKISALEAFIAGEIPRLRINLTKHLFWQMRKRVQIIRILLGIIQIVILAPLLR
jgi:hypothetical protein